MPARLDYDSAAAITRWPGAEPVHGLLGTVALPLPVLRQGDGPGGNELWIRPGPEQAHADQPARRSIDTHMVDRDWRSLLDDMHRAGLS